MLRYWNRLHRRRRGVRGNPSTMARAASFELRASGSRCMLQAPCSMPKAFFPPPYGGGYQATPHPGPLPVKGRGDPLASGAPSGYPLRSLREGRGLGEVRA